MAHIKHLLKTPQAAALLKVSPAAVQAAVMRGTLPYVGLTANGDYLFVRRDVRHYDQRRRRRRPDLFL